MLLRQLHLLILLYWALMEGHHAWNVLDTSNLDVFCAQALFVQLTSKHALMHCCGCSGYDRAAFKLRAGRADLNFPNTDYSTDSFIRVCLPFNPRPELSAPSSSKRMTPDCSRCKMSVLLAVVLFAEARAPAQAGLHPQAALLGPGANPSATCTCIVLHVLPASDLFSTTLSLSQAHVLAA